MHGCPNSGETIMAAKWVQVRLRADTHARLCDYRDKLVQALQSGKSERWSPYSDTISLDFTIMLILEECEKHKARSKKKASKTTQDERSED
jgi:hypothetical protein